MKIYVADQLTDEVEEEEVDFNSLTPTEAIAAAATVSRVRKTGIPIDNPDFHDPSKIGAVALAEAYDVIVEPGKLTETYGCNREVCNTVYTTDRAEAEREQGRLAATAAKNRGG